ncbi:carboxymuconolactone decarboxylase family protein [Ruegeria sp. MALMAid1280]|uniref:carboxymuconolactone decarboxylase family protein n=1 Tax=Ruegeria sp. MALMAid1280 TaxID=3411634 RepID=UPI003B9E181C
MPNMLQIDPKKASGATKEAFDEAARQFGGVINLFRVAGNAPNLLKGFLALNGHLNDGAELTGRQIELVAMLVSALNHCDYCVNVHMKVGMAQGATQNELLKALSAEADDAETRALLEYTDAVVRNRGQVPAPVLEMARAAGFSDKALLETIGVIGQYTLIQYVRHVADPDHDFPLVNEFDAVKHGAAFG